MYRLCHDLLSQMGTLYPSHNQKEEQPCNAPACLQRFAQLSLEIGAQPSRIPMPLRKILCESGQRCVSCAVLLWLSLPSSVASGSRVYWWQMQLQTLNTPDLMKGTNTGLKEHSTLGSLIIATPYTRQNDFKSLTSVGRLFTDIYF